MGKVDEEEDVIACIYGCICFKAPQTRMVGYGTVLNKIYYYYDATKDFGIYFPSSIIYD